MNGKVRVFFATHIIRSGNVRRSMLTSVFGTGTRVSGYPAESDIQYMCADDGQYSRDEEQELVFMKYLFEHEHHDTQGK